MHRFPLSKDWYFVVRSSLVARVRKDQRQKYRLSFLGSSTSKQGSQPLSIYLRHPCTSKQQERSWRLLDRPYALNEHSFATGRWSGRPRQPCLRLLWEPMAVMLASDSWSEFWLSCNFYWGVVWSWFPYLATLQSIRSSLSPVSRHPGHLSTVQARLSLHLATI